MSESQWAALADAFGEEPGSQTNLKSQIIKKSKKSVSTSDCGENEIDGDVKNCEDGESENAGGFNCGLCERDALRYRKRTERRTVEALEESFKLQPNTVTYVVSEEWMSAWRGFVTCEEDYPPGDISNAFFVFCGFLRMIFLFFVCFLFFIFSDFLEKIMLIFF